MHTELKVGALRPSIRIQAFPVARAALAKMKATVRCFAAAAAAAVRAMRKKQCVNWLGLLVLWSLGALAHPIPTSCRPLAGWIAAAPTTACARLPSRESGRPITLFATLFSCPCCQMVPARVHFVRGLSTSDHRMPSAMFAMLYPISMLIVQFRDW